jgi:non-ribosomal peptide synthetase component E (peptide arylation enzyme)
MKSAQTIRDLIASGHDDAPAIGAPGQPILDYAGLRSQVDRTVAELDRMGLARGDRVGIVLPNGPEIASAFVCLAAGVTTRTGGSPSARAS